MDSSYSSESEIRDSFISYLLAFFFTWSLYFLDDDGESIKSCFDAGKDFTFWRSIKDFFFVLSSFYPSLTVCKVTSKLIVNLKITFDSRNFSKESSWGKFSSLPFSWAYLFFCYPIWRYDSLISSCLILRMISPISWSEVWSSSFDFFINAFISYMNSSL